MQLSNRTFLISGGASGLGEATSKLLLSYNAYVSILDLNPPKDLSKEEESRTLFIITDVSSSSSLEDAIQSTIEWTQKTSAPLSGICTCAGIGTAALSLPKQKPEATHKTVKYYDMKHFDRVIGINLRGTVDLIRLVLPHMSLNKPFGDDDERGVIIVVSSVAAYEGQVGQLAYSASKGAVASIVLPLARELGQKAGISVM
jgi:NAD(P)-dependent dehydrogenase (short-subunit alcohol dehydrogenase family)